MNSDNLTWTITACRSSRILTRNLWKNSTKFLRFRADLNDLMLLHFYACLEAFPQVAFINSDVTRNFQLSESKTGEKRGESKHSYIVIWRKAGKKTNCDLYAWCVLCAMQVWQKKRHKADSDTFLKTISFSFAYHLVHKSK